MSISCGRGSLTPQSPERSRGGRQLHTELEVPIDRTLFILGPKERTDYRKKAQLYSELVSSRLMRLPEAHIPIAIVFRGKMSAPGRKQEGTNDKDSQNSPYHRWSFLREDY